MKTEIRKILKKKSFEPFEYVITIENEDQAKELWSRMNLSGYAIKEYHGSLDFNCSNVLSWWKPLDEELRKQKIICDSGVTNKNVSDIVDSGDF